MEAIESLFEWEIEALQEGFVNPTKYAEWKDDQAYKAYKEKDRKAYLEEEATENWFQEDWNQFFEEEDVETVCSLEENDEINEVFCNFMRDNATRNLPHEDTALGQPWPQGGTHEQGTSSPRAHSPQVGENIDWKQVPIISTRHQPLSNEVQVITLSQYRAM